MKKFFHTMHKCSNIYYYDVFTKKIGKGNSAAVVENFFSNEKNNMLSFAEKINKPATIFIFPSKTKEAIAKVHFFSPKMELDVCGHGSLAVSKRLFQGVDEKVITIETNNGLLDIERKESSIFQLVLPKKEENYSRISMKSVFSMLGISNDNFIHKHLPWGISSAGVPLFMFPLVSKEILDSIIPDFQAISEWSNKENLGGIYIYTSSERQDFFYSRCFNPRFNPKGEDIATGAAAGALGLLYQKETKSSNDIIISQGVGCENNPEIIVSLDPSNNYVKVGGSVIINNLGMQLTPPPTTYSV